MSKLICLAFALMILSTILCINSVSSQRSWKQSGVCPCRIHRNNRLHCKKNQSPKTREEYNNIVACICRNREKYLNDYTKKQIVNMCHSNSQTAL